MKTAIFGFLLLLAMDSGAMQLTKNDDSTWTLRISDDQFYVIDHDLLNQKPINHIYHINVIEVYGVGTVHLLHADSDNALFPIEVIEETGAVYLGNTHHQQHQNSQLVISTEPTCACELDYRWLP